MSYTYNPDLKILPFHRSVHLDAARGAAALVVFSGHTRSLFLQFWRTTLGLGAKPDPNDLAIFTSPSHEAVIVFFVLSGFLVGGAVVRSIKGARWSWGKYLAARLSRLWVVLIAALILTALLDALGKHIAPIDSLYFREVPDLAGDSGIITFLGNVLFLQTILVPTFGSDGQLWSLANEFWYYILFPMLLMIFVARSSVHKAASALAAVGILVLIKPKIASYFPMWLIGLIPFYLPKILPRRYARIQLATATFLLIFTLIALIKLRLNLFISDWITALIFSLWCYVALHDVREKASKFSLYHWTATHFSRMSYTLYLVHVPILMLISAIFVGKWRPWPLDARHLFFVFGIWIFVLAASYGFYFVFERNTDAIKRYVTKLFRRDGLVVG